MWLVCTKIDLKIAQDKGLLPTDISWDQWTTFSRVVLRGLEYINFQDISPRYHYGELRLQRINLIYRFRSREQKPTNLIRGYFFQDKEYSTFIQRNTDWLVRLAGYIALALTAMQVGPGTDKLKNNQAFQNASYGFTVFSVLGPLIVLGLIAPVVVAMVILNASYRLRVRGQQSQKLARTPTGQSSALGSGKQ
jgi:hypothetical protein